MLPKPSELPVQASQIAKARAWLQGKGHKNVLAGSKARTQKDVIEEVLALHGRTLKDLEGIDVA